MREDKKGWSLKDSLQALFKKKDGAKAGSKKNRSLPTSPRDLDTQYEETKVFNVEKLISIAQQKSDAEQKEKYLPHLENFIEDIQPALAELINLCGIISSTYFVSGKEDKLHPDDPCHKHTVFQIINLVKALDSTFITEKLYKPLENASKEEEAKFKTEFLEKWGRVELQEPEINPTLLNTVIRPINTEVADPLTLSSLLRKTDKEIFFSINAYHMPGVGGTRSRSVYEHSVLEFIKNFIKYIQHPDFEGLHDEKPKPFEDWDAYQFHFIDEIFRVISLLTQYLVEVIDYAYDIIFNGWKKIKFICLNTKRIKLQEQPYFEEIEDKIRVLRALREDTIFDDLRTSHFVYHEKNQEKLKPKTEKEMDVKTQQKFGDIIMRTEVFDIDSAPGSSWEIIINSVLEHRPKGEEQIPSLGQICESLLYCIDKAKIPVSKIQLLLDRNAERKCRFYTSYMNIVEEFNQVKDNPNFGMRWGGQTAFSPRKSPGRSDKSVQFNDSLRRSTTWGSELCNVLDDDTEEETLPPRGRRSIRKSGLNVLSVSASKGSRLKRSDEKRRKSTGNVDYSSLLGVINTEKKEGPSGRKTPVSSPRAEIKKSPKRKI